MTHATVEYVDMPSISKENLRDPGYMASLRVADAFAHVLRLFADETVPHEKGSVDPLRDLEDVDTELILSDLVVVEKRLERLDKDRKKIKNPELDREFELLERCKKRNAPVAQLDRASGYEPEGREFESLRAHHLTSIKSISSLQCFDLPEPLADLGQHCVHSAIKSVRSFTPKPLGMLINR